MLGNLLPPFPQNTKVSFLVIQYANDTIVVMKGCDSQLALRKEILHNITLSCGLVVNYQKSCLVPINVSS
jgi:hypothetical protein